jgi:diadenosine tetraphosphatase ApaH/serine/threonine PP2A family protein phosphatase
VGQPRDGNPKAKYCLYDTQSRELTVRFVSYDAATAARKIIDAGQPRVYAERLSVVNG